jgi:hypothetical protein
LHADTPGDKAKALIKLRQEPQKNTQSYLADKIKGPSLAAKNAALSTVPFRLAAHSVTWRLAN